MSRALHTDFRLTSSSKHPAMSEPYTHLHVSVSHYEGVYKVSMWPAIIEHDPKTGNVLSRKFMLMDGKVIRLEVARYSKKKLESWDAAVYTAIQENASPVGKAFQELLEEHRLEL